MTWNSTDAIQGDILIVDDQPDNIRLLSYMLSQQGHNVRMAISGELALMSVQSEPPDLILLDINMPQMNGYEVCQFLKADPKNCEVPVIFISAQSEIFDKVQAFQVGGVDYIAKPFQVEEVLARVKSQLSLRKLQTQLQKLNENLEAQVQTQTAQLQQALGAEQLLKQITEKVRDRLDENQILQTVVQELGKVLPIDCCNTGMLDSESLTFIICHEYTTSELSARGQVIRVADFPEYGQLFEGKELQFCPLEFVLNRSMPKPTAVLACPILGDKEVLADLWLFRQTGEMFSEWEVNLVRQVADQCAIAIRQARLYEKSQAQVTELERLSRLKDDFLSSISHELRTPMSNIRMATQMLEVMLFKNEQDWTENHNGHSSSFAKGESPHSPSFQKAQRYFKILQDECQREIRLINDLLDLNRLDARTEPLTLTTIDPKVWIPYVVEPFILLAQNQQKHLQVNLSTELPPITTDSSYLERVLTELLNNAFKYTPVEETIAVSTQKTAEKLEICISNSGVEIPQEECDRIFDKFYRIPNSDPWKYGGTGLGLALVKKRMEQLQGTVEVASEKGWTVFTVKLPIQ